MLISDLAEQAELGLGMFIHCFIFEHWTLHVITAELQL